MTRLKFFNGPHMDEIYSGKLVKYPNFQWMLELQDGTMIDAEFSIRMLDVWDDIKIWSSSEEEITFVPILKNGKRGKRFTRPITDFI